MMFAMVCNSTTAIHSVADLPPGCGVHLSGIGGSAMSGLAWLLRDMGFSVSGTDPGIDSDTTHRLRQRGIPLSARQDGSQIPPNCQLLVASAALPDGHPELCAARARNIPTIKYARMLGLIMNGRSGVAVAGTHGKTSTTALAVAAFRGADMDPGFVVGGYVPQFGTGAHGGTSTHFIAEACEFDRSFLNLYPRIAIVTNIEEDHLDIYNGLDDIVDAFVSFAHNLFDDGVLLYCGDDPGARRLSETCGVQTCSYGMGIDNTYRAHIKHHTATETIFTIDREGHQLGRIHLTLPGIHNVLNATAAFAAGDLSGLDPSGLAAGLASFQGVSRRFEWIGTGNQVDIVDDYAHHPTEIKALLDGTRKRYPNRRIVAVFQPHQISRTAALFKDFSTAFNEVDHLFLTDIYAARDTNTKTNTTSRTLAESVAATGVQTTYSNDLKTTCNLVIEHLRPGDLLLTIGAGNVNDLAHEVLRHLK